MEITAEIDTQEMTINKLVLRRIPAEHEDSVLVYFTGGGLAALTVDAHELAEGLAHVMGWGVTKEVKE